MSLDGRVIFDKSAYGDVVYRDAFVRGLALTGNGSVSQSAWCVAAGGNVYNATQVVSTAANGTQGAWSLFTKGTAANINTSSDTPQLYVSSTETRLAAEQITIRGALQSEAYAVFNDDVDIPSGNVLVGRDLTLGGNLYLGSSLKLETVAENSALLNAELLTVRGSMVVEFYSTFSNDLDIPSGNVLIGRDAIVNGNLSVGEGNAEISATTAGLAFGDTWRIRFDPAADALVFQARPQGGGPYVDRLVFSDELIDALNALVV